MYARVIHAVTLLMLIETCASLAHAQSAENLPYPTQRRPLRLDTLIVDRGKPAAVVVCPDAPEYMRLAAQISGSVRTATGTSLAVEKDSDYAELRGELKITPGSNVIVLGNMDCSGLVTYLCLMGYCTVDTLNPGRGGYVVRTVHDPWGSGVNVIALLGSDHDGVRLAVEHFCSRLVRGESLSIPRTIDARYSKELLARTPSLAADPSDQDIAGQLADQEKAFKAGVQGGLFNPIVSAGGSYNSTGHEGYARLFRDLLFLAEKLAKEGQGSFGGPWGAASDFLFGPLLTAWDNVEESPSLSDADRSHIVRIIMDYIRYWEQFGYVRGIEKPLLRTNHWTFEGQGWLAAGNYFGKYYDTPESEKWLRMADWCFGHQMKSFKPLEDCGAYQYITLRHMGRYATTRQDFSWYDSGKGRAAGDLAIMCMDNLGYQASFGDVGGFSPASHLAPLQMLATVERDGRWAWALQKSSRAVNGSTPWNYPNNTTPEEPADLLDVRCMSTDPLFFSHYAGKQKAAQENTFEKITFRRSFDPGDAYLLLDGISGGYHGHSDGNSILRLTDRSRIWLADSDYIKSLPKYHNTMLIFRDGQSTGLPTFCEREIVADLPSVGMTRTTIGDYGGADWSRSILWDKRHTFVAIDEMRARATDEYSFRCHWQALGEPHLIGSLFRATQGEASLSIRNLDGSRVRYVDDPVTGANWKSYRYADPVVRTLQQVKTQKLPAGGRVFIVNVLSTQGNGEAPVESVRVNDTSLLLRTGQSRALVGIGTGDTEIASGVETDARLYWLTGERISLGGATSLVVGGRTMHHSDSPVDVEVVLPRGFRVEFPKAMPLPAVEAVDAPTDSKLRVRGQFAPHAGACTALAADGTTVYVGWSDGVARALDVKGRQIWAFEAGSAVKAIWAGRLEKDGPVRVAVGTVKSKVFLLDERGQIVWTTELPFFKRDACVAYLTSADLAGDGNLALIVGAENWHQYAYDSKGNQLWAFEILHASTAGTGVDLDGDGRQEVIAGSDYYSWRAVGEDGKQIWDYKPIGPRANCITAGDVDGSGKPTVLFGGADGYIHAVDALGKRKWLYNTADEVTGLELADVDGDGTQDVVSGSLSFDVCAVKGDGTRIWRRDLGEPVSALALADTDGDRIAKICAGTEDGKVFVLGLDGKVIASWRAAAPIRRLLGVPDGFAAMTERGVTFLEISD